MSFGLMSTIGWLVIVLTGVAIIGIVYAIYPSFENRVSTTTRNYLDWAVDTSEKMFEPVSRKKFALLIAIFTVGMAALGFIMTYGNGIFIPTLFTVFFGYIGWSMVRFWVSMKWARRLRAFDNQLVDGLGMMANSLKSGLNLSQSIQVVVQEMPNPLAQEFGLVLSHEKIGLTTDEALEKMMGRIPSDDLSIAIQSVLILRETGGDLSETFETIAATIRERRKVDGKIKSMTAQGQMQGFILFCMPFALAALLYFTNPDYIIPLFTTQLGWIMISVMLFLQIIGGLWLRKIVKIDV